MAFWQHRGAAKNLHDAKAQFSEVVRRARAEGPQRVTVRGHDAVVVIAADEFERLRPSPSEALPFVAFMESLSLNGLDLTRDHDLGRDVSYRPAKTQALAPPPPPTPPARGGEK